VPSPTFRWSRVYPWLRSLSGSPWAWPPGSVPGSDPAGRFSPEAPLVALAPAASLVALAGGASSRLRRGERSGKRPQETSVWVRQLWRAVDRSPASVIITGKSGEIEYVNPNSAS